MRPDIEESLVELFNSANEFGRIRYAAATSRIPADTDVDMAQFVQQTRRRQLVSAEESVDFGCGSVGFVE